MYKVHKTKLKTTTAVEKPGVCKMYIFYTCIVLLCVLAIVRMYKLHILNSDKKLSLVIFGLIDYLF